MLALIAQGGLIYPVFQLFQEVAEAIPLIVIGVFAFGALLWVWDRVVKE